MREEREMRDLFEGFNFNDGLGVKSYEALSDDLGNVLRSLRPRRLEERERHRRRRTITRARSELRLRSLAIKMERQKKKKYKKNFDCEKV